MKVQIIANHNNQIIKIFNNVDTVEVGYNYLTMYDNRGTSRIEKYDVLCHKVRIINEV